jgi:nucleoside-triphosphatase THEP1
MKPLAGAEVSDFGTRFGFEAAGIKNSESEWLAESTEESIDIVSLNFV